MGKKIDYFVLTAGITAALYLYFRGAIGNRAASIALALFCCMLLNRTLRRLKSIYIKSAFHRKRQMRRHMHGTMMRLACMDQAKACEQIGGLFRKIYGADHAVEFVPWHPCSPLQCNDIFAVWRKHIGEDTLAICTTGRADAACRDMAAGLKQPRLAILDADALTRMIEEYPDGIFTPQASPARNSFRLRRLVNIFINRRNAPRCLLMFASMMLIYILSANLYYLASALFLLLIALISLRRQNIPPKLF